MDGWGGMAFAPNSTPSIPATATTSARPFATNKGTHEKVYVELKGGFAFDCIPTRRYAANSAWQLLRVLAFNLMRGFQMVTTAERRGAKRKPQPLPLRDDSHAALRCLHRAGVIVPPDGCATLHVGLSPAVVDRFTCLDHCVKAA